MRPQRTSIAVLLAAMAAGAALPAVAALPIPASSGAVIASGLNAPRGLGFGPDGYLYIAEAGSGPGATPLDSLAIPGCQTVQGPAGDYIGSNSSVASNGTINNPGTGLIQRVRPDGGVLQTVVDGLPSSQGGGGQGDVFSVADVAFLDGQLYALLGAGGCEHGNPQFDSGIALIDTREHKWREVVDLGKWDLAHPATDATPDVEVSGVPYSMIHFGDSLLVVDANHGQLIRVSPRSGGIELFMNIQALDGHIVPTSVAERYRALYLGNLGLFPVTPDSAEVQVLAFASFEPLAPGFSDGAPGYHIVDHKPGFTTVVAVKFGPDGLLYALEIADLHGFPVPPNSNPTGAGKVVRVNNAGVIEDVVTGLTLPTGMTFGPDGDLYVSNYGDMAGLGQVIRIHVPAGW